MNPRDENGSAPFRIAHNKQVKRNRRRRRESQPRPATQTTPEMYSSSGPLKITEVNSLGHFVRIMNTSIEQDIDISGYVLFQLEAGQVIATYRFPHNLLLASLQHVTVWASGAKVSQNPPTDLVWKGRVHFQNNPQCITVLARPNGQPVAFLKNKKSPLPWPEMSRPSLCKHQKTIRRPVMEQNKVYSISAPTTTVTRTLDAPDVRTSQNMSPYSTYIRPKLCSASRNSGGAQGKPHAVSVTWQPRRLNTNSPLIRLMVQKTARAKHGFNFLSHIPFTFDTLKI
ncbi:lamin tail domain-containing protein 2-like [Leptodactylus fuscus]